MRFKNTSVSKHPVFKFFTVKRPWGKFVNYGDNSPCTVKILYIKPNERLSLQYHFKRDQLYVFLDDGFLVHDDNDIVKANAGDVYGFERGKLHRAEYLGKNQYGRVLDIAFGENDEEDIVRVDDDYKRDNGKYAKDVFHPIEIKEGLKRQLIKRG